MPGHYKLRKLICQDLPGHYKLRKLRFARPLQAEEAEIFARLLQAEEAEICQATTS